MRAAQSDQPHIPQRAAPSPRPGDVAAALFSEHLDLAAIRRGLGRADGGESRDSEFDPPRMRRPAHAAAPATAEPAPARPRRADAAGTGPGRGRLVAAFGLPVIAGVMVGAFLLRPAPEDAPVAAAFREPAVAAATGIASPASEWPGPDLSSAWRPGSGLDAPKFHAAAPDAAADVPPVRSPGMASRQAPSPPPPPIATDRMEIAAPRLLPVATIPPAATSVPAEAPTARRAAVLRQVAAPTPPVIVPAVVRPALQPRPRPAALRADAPAPAATSGGGRVVVHAGAAQTGAARDRVLAVLTAAGVARVEFRTVPHAVGRNNARYFRAEDSSLADEIMRALRGEGYAVELRDFRHFDPPPARGTIELWLKS